MVRSEETKGWEHPLLRRYSKPKGLATERRRKQRMKCSYPALVRGHDAWGDRFENEGVLDDLSSGGLRLRLRDILPRNSRLFIVVQFAPSSEIKSTRLVQGIAACGVVQRVELLPDGVSALGVEFRRYRFVDIANEQAQLLRTLRDPKQRLIS